MSCCGDSDGDADISIQIRALPGGVQRLANVEMLLAKAQDYEKISYHGLFHFVRYIERMQKYQMDFGEADISGKRRSSGTDHEHPPQQRDWSIPGDVCGRYGERASTGRKAGRKWSFHSRWGVGLDYVDTGSDRIETPGAHEAADPADRILWMRSWGGTAGPLRSHDPCPGEADPDRHGIDEKTDRSRRGQGEPTACFPRSDGSRVPAMAWILPALNPGPEQEWHL